MALTLARLASARIARSSVTAIAATDCSEAITGVFSASSMSDDDEVAAVSIGARIKAGIDLIDGATASGCDRAGRLAMLCLRASVLDGLFSRFASSAGIGGDLRENDSAGETAPGDFDLDEAIISGDDDVPVSGSWRGNAKGGAPRRDAVIVPPL